MLPHDIIDHIASFVGVATPDGTTIEINETTLRVSGASRDDVIGRKAWEAPWFAYDPKVAAGIKDAVERAASGETVRFDTNACAASGEILTIEFMIYPVRDATGRVTSLIPSALDITERKRLENELRRAQRIAQLGYWSFDIKSGHLEWSDEAQRIFFGCPSPEVTREQVESKIHADDRDRVVGAFRAAFKERERLSTSYRVRREDGVERIIEVEADPEFSPGGEPTRMFGIVRDITEARERERTIVEQQQLIDLSLEPIFCWSVRDGLLHWNPGCEQLYGYSRQEALGHPPHELLSTQFPVPYAEIEERLLAGASWTGEAVQTAKDGRRLTVEARLDPAEAESGKLVLEAHRDVTARKDAERRLKLSEERLAIASDLVGVGFFDHDQIADIIYFSPEPWGGMIPEIATLENIYAVMHPEDVASFRAAVSRAHDPAGDGQFDHLYRLVRKSGEIRWISVKSRTFFEGEGKDRHAIRTVGAVVDVTERRNWEEQQRLLMGELNHRVRNTLSVVQAIASQTLRGARDPRSFVDDFKGRIQAIASAHKLLNETTWQGANLTDLLREQLQSTCGSGQLSTNGPEVWLPPQVALNLGLVLHELGTNARKYGALSVPGGRIRLSWEVDSADGKPALRMTWRESGGPPVRPTTVRGFGMGLIERTIGTRVEGATNIRFDPEGLICVIELPLETAPVPGAIPQ